MNAQKFKDWFANRLTIGAWPGRVNKAFELRKYRYIINVSDEFYHEDYKVFDLSGVRQFWFAMSEQKKDMGLNSIYSAMVVLWQAEQDCDTVYLHCHSGSNRSWTVAAAYYFMRTGQHLDRPTRSGDHENKLTANCSRGYLPPRAETEAFLRAIWDDLKDGMKPGILTLGKINTVKNF